MDTRYTSVEDALNDGDLVVARTGASTGVSAYINEPPPAVFASYLVRLQIDGSVADARFVSYYLRGSQFWNYMRGVLGDKSAQPNASAKTITQAPASFPNIVEQRTIASVLGSLDDKIEQNRRTARTLEQLARAIFRAWFVDFEPVKAKAAGATSFPSMPQPTFDALPTTFINTDIGSVPEGWEVKAIGDMVTVKGGGTPSTKNPEYWDGGVHCWATPKDMSRLIHPVLLDTARHITDAGIARISSGLLPTGTVLLSSRAPVGYLAIAAVPTAINQGFIAMVCDGLLPPCYVLNWTYQSLDAIKAHASGTTFPEISKRTFRPLPIVVPPPAVVSAYAALADPMFELLTGSVQENDRLATMRDYLLPKLLSGEVKVEVCDG